jgi:hypothetical protein
MACAYSGIFGEPNEGAHRWRLGGLAAVDVLGTAGVAVLIAMAARRRRDSGIAIAAALIFIILILAGIVAHEAFCVNTRLNAIIFRRPWGAASASTPAPASARVSPIPQ